MNATALKLAAEWKWALRWSVMWAACRNTKDEKTTKFGSFGSVFSGFLGQSKSIKSQTWQSNQVRIMESVVHVHRSYNPCAHELAHSGLSGDPDQPTIWFDPLPSFVRTLLDRDLTANPEFGE